MPGELFLIVSFGLPAILTAHEAGVRSAGYVAFGMSLLLMVGAMITPFGIVLLPKASELAGAGNICELTRQVRNIFVFSLALTASVTLVLELTLPMLIRTFLGYASPEATAISQILTLAAIPYGTYICLRSAIDACHERAINTANIVISFGGFLLAASVLHLYHVTRGYSIIWLFVFAVWGLAFLTTIRLRMLLAGPKQGRCQGHQHVVLGEIGG